jgi:ABC-2 type transport system ATP-binding protein
VSIGIPGRDPSNGSGAPAIRLENLTKTFGRGANKITAAQNLNLEIRPGEVFGFLGPNGAGKTTTIRMILDLVRPTAGDAFIFGRHVHFDHAVLRRVGAIAEGPSFYPFLTGWRNLEVLGRTAEKFDEKRMIALLDQVGIGARAHQRVRGYSLGMKQRLGLAAALLNDPDVLVLDEPTNGLDPAGMQEVRVFIREQAAKFGKAIFLSSHLLNEVEQICDRVAIINKGVIISEGVVHDLLAAKTELRIEATPVEKATAALEARWRSIRREADTLVVDAPREDTPHVVRVLVEAGVDVYHIASQRQSLEEFFLSVTQNSDQELGQMADQEKPKHVQPVQG